MGRSFYFFGIFLLGLSLASGLFWSILTLRIDSQLYWLYSFDEWILVITVISTVALLLLLKYFHYKKYWFTFSAGLAFMIASLFHFTIIYNMLVYKETSEYTIPAYQVKIGVGILYGISLVVSSAGKRLWLKISGVYMLIIGLLLMSSLLWSMNATEVSTYRTLATVHQGASIASILLSAFFMMNFWRELRVLKPHSRALVLQRIMSSLFIVAGALALIVTLQHGQKLYAESDQQVPVKRYIPTRRAELLAQPFEARTYIGNNGDTLKYRLLKPLNYDPNIDYPLVVCLHGGGGVGTDNTKQIEGSWTAQLLSRQSKRERYPAFIFVPQCPPDATWGGMPYQPAVMETIVLETIDALEEAYSIDEKRRYVMGESLGGYGTWYLISARPDMFAAAVPICGAGNKKLAPNLIDVPVWAFHGRNDRSVPVSGSRDMIEAIKTAGGNPNYTEFPDEGHNIYDAFYNTPGVLDWLFAQKKE